MDKRFIYLNLFILLMKSRKAMSSWTWILIILILMSIGVGIYFWLTGEGSEVLNSVVGGGNSGLQPPALPE